MTLCPFCFTQAVQFPVCRVLNYQVLHYFVEQLSRHPETVKLLILVSDAQPADTGYYGTAAEEDRRGIKQEYTRKKILFAAAAIGDDNTCIWGSFSDGDHSDMAIGMAQEALKKEILETVRNYGQLPSESMGCTITWFSTEPDIIGEDGQVNVPAEDTKMVLTATITSGETSQDVEYKVTVRAQ